MKDAAAARSTEEARENEWTLRSLENEIEAQAQWRQGVAESLQQRLDEKSKEVEALKQENDTLKADQEARAADVNRENEWKMRTLEAEIESQAQWRQGVADLLQQRLDEKSKEVDMLMRAEVTTAKAEINVDELKARHKDEKEKIVRAMEEAHKFALNVLEQTVEKKDVELARLKERLEQHEKPETNS